MLLLCSCPKPAPDATIRSRWSKWWGTTSTATLKRTSSVRSNGGTKWTKTPGGRLHWRVTGASCPDLFFCLAYNPSSVSSPRKAHPTQSPINFQHPGFFTSHSHLYLLIFSNRILSRWATWFPSLFKHCDSYDSSEIIFYNYIRFLFSFFFQLIIRGTLLHFIQPFHSVDILWGSFSDSLSFFYCCHVDIHSPSHGTQTLGGGRETFIMVLASINYWNIHVYSNRICISINIIQRSD